MKISYQWLQDFIDISQTPEELSEILTQTGLEVESVEKYEPVKGSLKGLVVGEVKSCKPHPNADKLTLTEVFIGEDFLLPIVCGAPNVAVGQKVVVATVGTELYPVGGSPFTIKKAKIRGEVSEGMICAEDEIGLGKNHEGILVLDPGLVPGTPASALYDVSEDFVFEIGLTPNRGDAASHLGVARDIKAFTGNKIQLPKLEELPLQEKNPISIHIENTEACPRYCGVTLRGVKVTESPEWLKRRLKSIGLEPINNVVDCTNYVLHSIGQPLHAFDADKIDGNIIRVKILEAGTKFTTLDGKERELAETDLMICGDRNPLCMAGVFGGMHSGVSNTTTNIFLESAYFSQDSVRASAMRHGLSTDASFRFERGADPEITLYALKLASALIIQVAGGHRASNWMDIYPKAIDKVSIKSSYKTFDRLIGIALGDEKIINILNSLDIATIDKTTEGFTAVVPAFRSEVTREADLVEEVLRIYGINNIPLSETNSAGYLAEFSEREPYKLQEEISLLLAGKGFQEILTNSLTSHLYHEKMGKGSKQAVVMLNPSSEDLNILKPEMYYTGLESVRFNLNRKQFNLRFFEFGKTYEKQDKRYVESEKLTLYMTGNLADESWMEIGNKSTFHHLKGIVDDLIHKLGFDQSDTVPVGGRTQLAYGIDYKSGKETMAMVGRLSDEITSYMEIGQEVFYAEINWGILCKKLPNKKFYQSISKYPEVRRDLSLILDSQISFDQVRSIAFETDKKFLRKMNVFSVFEGEQIGKGKKAYALAFYLQDNHKTLTEKEIDKSMSSLMDAFEKQLNAIIRK